MDLRQRINLEWLIRLRWGAMVGQFAAVVAVAYFLDIQLPLKALLAVLWLTAVSNVALVIYRRKAKQISEALIGCVVTADITLLTVLLYLTGGATNPFNFLYLVHVALSAVTLRVHWIVVHVSLALASFVALLWYRVPFVRYGQEGLPAGLHEEGMVVAFALAAAFIVYFVHRLSNALRAKDMELSAANDAAARTQRLTSLATLAAGAAHELATPLATIAIVAKELERHLVVKAIGNPQLQEDARLIRREVERCRAVLTHMAADAGASSGEPLAPVMVEELVQAALSELKRAERVQVSYAPLAAQKKLCLPLRSVAQALRSVLKNGLEASELSHEPVRLRVGLDPDNLALTVEDRGKGMTKEQLERVGEPFFTTKAPGFGMGLGVFLTRTVFEGLGGSVSLDSTADYGSCVVLKLPLSNSLEEKVSC